VRIPNDAIIAWEKLTHYLLVRRLRDDKSQYLARGGFTGDNPERLHDAIRELAASYDAEENGTSDYGVFLRVEGHLKGPEGVSLPVVTIWLRWHLDGTVHFVTLKPRSEGGA